MPRLIVLVLLVTVQFAFGQSRFDRFALILEDPPLAARASEAPASGRRLASAEGMSRIRAAQSRLSGELEQRGVRVRGATQLLLNAIYVQATAAQAAELRGLPGVARVVRLRPLKRQMDQALGLVRAPQAWNQIGGIGNAGAGVKIAILDTGIDDTHPAFQDASLDVPGGYPRCAGSDCQYTNNKIIAARSYVDLLVLPATDSENISRPDDLSPRDRVGHGTAVAMVAAGARVTGPSATVSGMAPKAFLGNYKIFGSPGVNDVTFDDVIARALEDALLDGMDIAVLPVSGPALWGAADRGPDCNEQGIVPCDPRAAIVNNAIEAGLTVVVPAGNDGDLSGSGSGFPALNSIHSPGTVAAAITAGAFTNSHVFFASVKTSGGGVPSWIGALFGDGPVPGGPFTAPVRDVGATEPNAKACSPVGNGTLTGAIALMDRGDCAFSTKVNNAQRGGARAAIIVNDSNLVFPMTGLTDTGIPAVLIGATDGAALRSFVASNPDHPSTLDPRLEPVNAPADEIAFFSSRGPAIRDSSIKPEVVAVGTDVYMATQVYDPNGDMWDPSRYTAAQGTSFAVPMVAGAAAMVKQLNPSFGPADLKSAVVNTATTKDQLADFDANGAPVATSVTAAGAGKLNAERAVKTTVVADPATLSFGVIDGDLPSRGLRLKNTGGAPVTVNLSVNPPDNRLTFSSTSVALAPGVSALITVSVNAVPPPGSYEGYVVVTGGAATLNIPYLYLRGDGVPANVVPLTGIDFVGNVNEFVDHATFNLNFKVIDRFGVPVPNVTVDFAPVQGGGRIENALGETDGLGIAAATAELGPNPGSQAFTGRVRDRADLVAQFFGIAKIRPSINEGGIVNGASFQPGQAVAPGSYISIFGTSLSDAFRLFSTPYLPVSLAGVSVSFDVPSAGLSLPGRLNFVDPNQINVQVPWELAGQNTVLVKVSTGPITENIASFVLALNNFGPGFFETPDPAGSGRVIIAALDVNFALITSANPATPGKVAQLFANGIGPVDNTPESGEPTPTAPLARTLEVPVVTIGGRDAHVTFGGLSPGSIALYQVNVTVPEGLAPGIYEVVLTIGGVQAKKAFLYVG